MKFEYIGPPIYPNILGKNLIKCEQVYIRLARNTPMPETVQEVRLPLCHPDPIFNRNADDPPSAGHQQTVPEQRLPVEQELDGVIRVEGGGARGNHQDLNL